MEFVQIGPANHEEDGKLTKYYSATKQGDSLFQPPGGETKRLYLHGRSSEVRTPSVLSLIVTRGSGSGKHAEYPRETSPHHQTQQQPIIGGGVALSARALCPIPRVLQINESHGFTPIQGTPLMCSGW